MQIKKLIIPAAGLGTRFLPITAALPKELAPLGTRAALEVIFQEAVDAGIDQMGLIISPQKEIIKKYCTKELFAPYLPAHQARLTPTLNLLDTVYCSFFYQHTPGGVAHALLQAESFIKPDEWFAVAFPDDIIHTSDLQNMIKYAQQYQACIVALQKVPLEKVSAYGIATPGSHINSELISIQSFIEKPSPGQAPSQLAIVGRYIMPPVLFDWIRQTPPAKSGEILLPDTISLLIKHGFPVLGYELQKPRFDIGTLPGWQEYIVQNSL